VWHASVAYHGRVRVPDELRRDRALAMLRNVGDPLLGEWHESSPSAHHIRRRLTPDEAVGLSVRDVRWTPEAETRLKVMPREARERIPAFIIAEEVVP